MPFEFIDNSLIDRGTRRKIRSHVMKEKNVGKKRPPKKRAPRMGLTTAMPKIVPRVEMDAQNLLSSPVRQIGNELSLFPFPGGLTSRSRGMVYKLILDIDKAVNQPKLCCQSVDISASIWIRYIFLDEAYFHSTVAKSIMYNDPHLVKYEDAIESLRHLLRATCLINERLSGNEALSDTNIATVVGLIQYERLRGRDHDGMIHFTGLQRIIKLRGGIARLTRNPHLAQKIFRTDIEIALYYGVATQFHVEDIPGQILSQLRSTVRDDQEQQIWNFQLVRQLSSNLQGVLSDILTLVYLLNNHDKLPIKLSAYSFQDTVILLSYRLVQISHLAGPRPTIDLEDMLHLTLTALTTTLFLGFGSTTSKVPLLSELFRETVQRYVPNNTESQKILLWVLFMGKASVFTNRDEWWLIPKITKITLALDLHTWADVRLILSQFPWVYLIHDQAGIALWEKSEVCNILPSQN